MRNFILFAVLLSLAACGFRPVYGVNRDTPTGVEEKLAQVDIANIPDREGQYLRNQLIDRFYRDGRPVDPKYTLNAMNLTETKTDLDITKSSDTTRAQLRETIGYYLVDNTTGETVLSRSAISITSYNVLGSEFATRVTEENARTDALDDLARQIELQLNLYFKRQ
jgi:LPS-assembly lipoprotein